MISVENLHEQASQSCHKPYLVKEAGVQDISYSFLGSDYFSDMRSHLSDNKLNQLAEFAEILEMPKTFGKFNSEKHYLDTYQLVTKSSDELRHRGFFYLKNILSRLRSRHKFLDVGPGNGELLCWIGNQFKHVSAIDYNQEALENLNANRNLLKKSIYLEKKQASILDLDLPQNSYDLASLAHVLYYIPQERWLEVIKKLYGALKVGGHLVIVLSGDRNGKAALMKHFGGAPLSSDNLVFQINKQLKAKVSVFESYEFYRSLSFTAILHIAGFFLADTQAIAREEELIQYVNEHFYDQQGGYYLSSQQKFIVVQRLA